MVTPLAILTISLFPLNSPLSMHHMKLLGYVDDHPATFVIDQSAPCTTVAEAFLFRCGVNPVINTLGQNTLEATLLIPSLGGFYKS